MSDPIPFDEAIVKDIISNHIGKQISHLSVDIRPLSGGTVAQVYKLLTTSTCTDGTVNPFSLVLKIQKKWERPGDPNSWRREFDLLNSSLPDGFFADFGWPACYKAIISQQKDEIRLYMEYIEGFTGKQLDGDMLALAARKLGEFQGKTYNEKKRLETELDNLSALNYLENFYSRYRSWPVVFDYIRQQNCDIPKECCEMIIDFDQEAKDRFDRIKTLPIVLCHRDYWIANLFVQKEKVTAIDWDTAGWGYLGEDIASLIADEPDIDTMIDNFDRIVDAYIEGFRKEVDLAGFDRMLIIDMIIAMYGYRLVEWIIFSENEQHKNLNIQTLKNIVSIKKRISSETR